MGRWDKTLAEQYVAPAPSHSPIRGRPPPALGRQAWSLSPDQIRQLRQKCRTIPCQRQAELYSRVAGPFKANALSGNKAQLLARPWPLPCRPHQRRYRWRAGKNMQGASYASESRHTACRMMLDIQFESLVQQQRQEPKQVGGW